MHTDHGDYDIPDFVNGTNIPHPWTFSSTKILVFCRDQGICRVCGKKVKLHDNNYEGEVHHIMPRSKGGSDHPKNLILLCVDCHNLTKSNGNDYGGVPMLCVLPFRKYLPAGQKTFAAYFEVQ